MDRVALPEETVAEAAVVDVEEMAAECPCREVRFKLAVRWPCRVVVVVVVVVVKEVARMEVTAHATAPDLTQPQPALNQYGLPRENYVWVVPM